MMFKFELIRDVIVLENFRLYRNTVNWNNVIVFFDKYTHLAHSSLYFMIPLYYVSFFDIPIFSRINFWLVSIDRYISTPWVSLETVSVFTIVWNQVDFMDCIESNVTINVSTFSPNSVNPSLIEVRNPPKHCNRFSNLWKG